MVFVYNENLNKYELVNNQKLRQGWKYGRNKLVWIFTSPLAVIAHATNVLNPRILLSINLRNVLNPKILLSITLRNLPYFSETSYLNTCVELLNRK